MARQAFGAQQLQLRVAHTLALAAVMAVRVAALVMAYLVLAVTAVAVAVVQADMQAPAAGVMGTVQGPQPQVLAAVAEADHKATTLLLAPALLTLVLQAAAVLVCLVKDQTARLVLLLPQEVMVVAEGLLDKQGFQQKELPIPPVVVAVYTVAAVAAVAITALACLLAVMVLSGLLPQEPQEVSRALA